MSYRLLLCTLPLILLTTRCVFSEAALYLHPPPGPVNYPVGGTYSPPLPYTDDRTFFIHKLGLFGGGGGGGGGGFGTGTGGYGSYNKYNYGNYGGAGGNGYYDKYNYGNSQPGQPIPQTPPATAPTAAPTTAPTTTVAPATTTKSSAQKEKELQEIIKIIVDLINANKGGTTTRYGVPAAPPVPVRYSPQLYYPGF